MTQQQELEHATHKITLEDIAHQHDKLTGILFQDIISELAKEILVLRSEIIVLESNLDSFIDNENTNSLRI